MSLRAVRTSYVTNTLVIIVGFIRCIGPDSLGTADSPRDGQYRQRGEKCLEKQGLCGCGRQQDNGQRPTCSVASVKSMGEF